MTNKRIQLPKEGLVEPAGPATSDPLIAGNDVEGHGFANPAPPADFSKRSPGHGGEAIPTDESNDAEGPTRH